MQIYFHSRLCSYLPRVPILVEGTVYLFLSQFSLFGFRGKINVVNVTSPYRLDSSKSGIYRMFIQSL